MAMGWKELQDAICNDIVGGGDLVCIDPHWIVDHGSTLEEAKVLSSQ